MRRPIYWRQAVVILLTVAISPWMTQARDIGEFGTDPLYRDSGKEPSSCRDEQVNRQWEDAVNTHKDDHLVSSLYATRIGLCELLAAKKIDFKSAHFTWEQAVISALVDRGKEVTKTKQGTDMLKLFWTF